MSIDNCCTECGLDELMLGIKYNEIELRGARDE